MNIDTQISLQDSLEKLKLEDGVQGVRMLEPNDVIQNVLPDPLVTHLHVVVEPGQFLCK